MSKIQYWIAKREGKWRVRHFKRDPNINGSLIWKDGTIYNRTGGDFFGHQKHINGEGGSVVYLITERGEDRYLGISYDIT
jgi:hypothetical protein